MDVLREVSHEFLAKLALQDRIRVNEYQKYSCTPFKQLEETFIEQSDKYLERYPDANAVDFVDREITRVQRIIAWFTDQKYDPSWVHSLNKFLVFLNQERDMELASVDCQNYLKLDSNRERQEVILWMLCASQNNVFIFKNDSTLARFIEKYCTHSNGQKITGARATISMLRSNGIDSEKYRAKWAESFNSPDFIKL
jgi:hypothetical protein